MYKIILWSWLVLSSVLFASTELDAEHGFRSIAAVVTNVDDVPVYGEHVENEIISFLRKSARFEFSDSGYLYLKDRVRPVRAPQGDLPGNTMLEPLKPSLKELDKMGVSSVLLAEVVKSNSGDYKVVINLATTKGESAFVASANVEGLGLESFSLAVTDVLKQMMAWLPFDATVIRRDGYLVVLDRGLPVFQRGQTLSAYTLEKKDGKIQFVESGIIGFTQVDENISFAKILVERRPTEVTVGNKIRLDNKPAIQISPSLWSVGERELSSLNRGDSFEVTKGKFGVVGASLGGAVVGYTTKKTDGPEQAMSNVYPSGTLNGEIWLTGRITLGLNMSYGMAGQKEVGGTTNTPVSSNLSGFSLLAGYRINLLAPEPGPILHLKAGIGKQAYLFNSTKELLYTSTTYSGLQVAGGATFPISDRIGLGFDIESLIFPGVSEEPFTSGTEVSDISAWDFVFRGYYRFNKEMDFEGKLFFARNGATFSGAKTRSLSFNESSQTVTGLQAGVSYYF